MAGPALVGKVIDGRYRIGEIIGEGGMGAVYAATVLQSGRKVALKRLHPELASDTDAVRRFQREARAAGATGHVNVVDVIDLGYAEDGAPYLAMELLEGESLASRLSRGRLEPGHAVDVALQTLSGLDAVHAHGVIHRDLKPDNIFLAAEGPQTIVKILDFGISKMHAPGDVTDNLTRTGTAIGTPQYMSPEQARGVRVVDHRVDLYALGVILYQALGGQLPFRGSNYHALLQAILGSEAPRLAVIAPMLDAGLCAVVSRAMSRRTADRYEDAQEMAKALRPFEAATGIPTPAIVRSIPAPDRTSSATRPSAFAPRAYVATSRDWSEKRRLQLEAREPPSAYAPTQAAPATAAVGRPRVKGSFVLAMQSALETREGAGTWTNSTKDVPGLSGMILAVGWIAQSAVERWVGTLSNESLLLLGADTANVLLPRAHRMMLKGTSPRAVAERLPDIHHRYFDGSVTEVTCGDTEHVLTFSEDPCSPMLMVMLSGFYAATLRLAGAETVEPRVEDERIRLAIPES